MPLNDNICSRILTPKQVGPICWFMATFVAMFYSQRSRKILLETSNSWNNKKALFALLKHVLDDKYLKKTDGRESDDYNKFRDDTFIKILSYLNMENNKIFPYDPKKVTGGFIPLLYIGKLYKLLNVDYKIFNYYTRDDTLTYSHLNEEYDAMIYTIINKKIRIDINVANLLLNKNVENKYAPPILIVNLNDSECIQSFNKINEGDTKEQLKSMREQIFYNGKEYNLDAVILANWNINKRTGHAIAGITCKKNKYVYNGWTRTSMDPVMAKNITRNIPCELMKYDWNIIKNNDFCLNTTKCIPELLKRKLKVKDLCFNFSKGSRILIYVSKDAKPYTSSDKDANVVKLPTKSPKKCPEGKVLNPKTGRCIKNKNLIDKKPSVKSPKKCPEGKVLNPKTGRCIKNKHLIDKKPSVKSPKKCPEGKILNPKTGRCILIKNKR